MIPSYRQRFNREWSEEKYERFLGLIEKCCGEPPPFRHSETPCFFPTALIRRTAQYGREMVEQLLADARYRELSQNAIPPAFRVPNESEAPLFVQADFGLDERGEPKLVEIQGFPSLYAYQPFMAECYREAFGISADAADLPEGLSQNEYHALMRRAIVAEHDEKNVILLEIDPQKQKTRGDFLFTERLYGVRALDIRDLRKQGRRLFYPRDGRLVPVHRIYNRAIADELVRLNIAMPFDFRDELDVEWAGHPNWFFRLSKFSLPFLKHPAVPETRFLGDVTKIDDPSRYVLKPLYSFAGLGVIVGPTQEQIDAVPADKRASYILQKRVNFAPVIETPHGLTRVEIRIMYVWEDSLRFVNTVVRMGRGAQMGVDHNKGAEWVGASAAFLVQE